MSDVLLQIDPLAHRPMTADEIADLVERASAASRVAQSRAAHSGGVACRRAFAEHPSLCRVAARCAALAGVSIAQAAADVSEVSGYLISASGVDYQWRRMYPGVPTSLRRRGAR